MKARETWTLSQAARLLSQPQHRLIYFCEKAVVIPDLADARGRGTSRRFSARNLLEFAIALKLRELLIPVAPIAAILRVLREFERKVSKEIPGFELPERLRHANAPVLRIVIIDGGKLFFTIGRGKAPPKVYGGLDLGKLQTEIKANPRRRGRSSRKPSLRSARLPERDGSTQGSVQINVTRIARTLPLDS